ncbi:cupredoxin domain-containing protein [Candidatus Micrarchaeota archaeon]|nr:cupredoxin domain-containing protein [Candidatus Micrarchaeota archaeon]
MSESTIKSFAILGVAFLLLFGCFSSPPPENTTNTTPVVTVKNPSFTISSPQEGDIINAQTSADITLVLSTQNLLLKSPGGAAKKGEGHFRVTVDDAEPAVLSSKSYTINALSVGEHTIKVQLYNNDKTPYLPQLIRTVHFSITPAVPSVYVPKTYTVTMNDLSYDPVVLSVNVGDSITFVNSGSRPASATALIPGKQVFNTQVIGPGKNATVTVTEIGEFEYYSLINPIMRGKIIVKPAPIE